MNNRIDLHQAKQLADDVLKRISETDMSGAKLFDRYNYARNEIAKAYDSFFHDEDVTVAFASSLIGTPFEKSGSVSEFNSALNEQSSGVNLLNCFLAQPEMPKKWAEDLKAEMNKLPERFRHAESIAIFNDIDEQLAAIDNMLSAMSTVNLIDTMNELVLRKEEMLAQKAELENVNFKLYHLRLRIEVDIAKSQSPYGKLSTAAFRVFGFLSGSSAQSNSATASSLSASSSESSAGGHGYNTPRQ